ncbi:hypothetical protein [Jeongeupia sp. USM3]|uniref:hypothetical protein n=1 Tax=Jeongeupia sp. USM3 TaxID=1906741 RepID=UPI0011AB45FC|nr:hypothetical protein [Jeongeupia sp. USM3]
MNKHRPCLPVVPGAMATRPAPAGPTRSATVIALMVGDGLAAALLDPLLAAGYRISGCADPRFYVLDHTDSPNGNGRPVAKSAA